MGRRRGGVDAFQDYASTRLAVSHALVEAAGEDLVPLTYSRQVITDTASQVLENGKRVVEILLAGIRV